MEAKELGEFIAKTRKENQITQAELAKRLNVTDKAVSRWERGLGYPDINTLEPLADALGVSLTEMMQCSKNMRENNDNEIIASKNSKKEGSKTNHNWGNWMYYRGVYCIICGSFVYDTFMVICD